jgi:hypothetical protein
VVDGALEGTRDDEGPFELNMLGVNVSEGIAESEGIIDVDGNSLVDGTIDVEGTPESVGDTDIDGAAAVGDEVGGTYHLYRPNCK